MKCRHFGLNFFESSKPRKITSTLGAQAIGFQHASGGADAGFETQQKAGGLHVVRRRNASL